VLRNHGIDARHEIRLDARIHVLNSTATRHDLDSTARLYLGVETIHYEDVAGKGSKQPPFNQVPVERAGEYGPKTRRVAAPAPGAAATRKAAKFRNCTRRPSNRWPVLPDMEHSAS
jgi:DNA polymerase I-like protein with 3'-5' exonuclease and polymerase domains